MVGEVKSMDKGVVIVSTSYSDKDFNIEWSGISQIFTESYFLISLTDGTRYNGTLETVSPGVVEIILDNVIMARTELEEIVYLLSVDRSFWSKLSLSVGFGYNLTRANNLNQFNTRSNVAYRSDNWSSSFSYNAIRSTQENSDEIRRTEIHLNYRYFLSKDWYAFIPPDLFTNSEQKLNLRTTILVGGGRFITKSNNHYISILGGANFNNEDFNDGEGTENSDRQSLEGLLGLEVNLFNIGDLNFLTTATAFPSITEERRVRVDHKLDIKYDFPLDFYIKVGYTLNFDNQPAAGAVELDYVLQTTFGWEL